MNRHARNERRKGPNHMTTSETTNKAAAVADPGAHAAPKDVSSKKGASQKKSAPKGHKAAKGGKSKVAKKGAKD